MVWVLLFQSPQPLLFAQAKPQGDQTDYNELYKSVLDRYGFDQVLVNGAIYTDMYRKKEGHQFLGEDRLYTGNLVFRGKQYVGLEMKYDICNQLLIVFITANPLQEGIIPPHDFISAFSLGDMSFSKMDFQGEARFYQVIFESDQLKCLYHWSKQALETAGSGNNRYFHYEFTKSKRKRYLFIDGSFQLFRNNSSFIGLFPQDIRTGIGHFMKTNHIKVSRSSDERMFELMTYCNTVLK